MITTTNGKTFRVEVQGSQWAYIMYNDKGDLYINSDWGCFGFAWRSFGKDFEDFLLSINTDYLLGKLESNLFEIAQKKINKNRQEHIAILFTEFQNELKALKTELI